MKSLVSLKNWMSQGPTRRAETAVSIQNRKRSIPRVGYTADEIVEMQTDWDGEACHQFAAEEADVTAGDSGGS